MKLFYKVFLVLFLFSGTNIFAQDPPMSVQELSKKYSDYFTLNRETVFLHLNKTRVVPTEDIWFSAYVYQTKSMTPSMETTNLHVNLYNDKGRLMEAKTVFIEDGQGSGYFELDSLYAPGKYLIKASTKYMENFREDLSFSHSFTILGEVAAPIVERTYDLQLLPEGGHFVVDIANTVGIKLIDNSGQSVFFTEGKVLNEKQHTVSTFSSNQFGLAKFRIVPKMGKEYTVVLTTEDGVELKKKMPLPETEGIVISANSMVPGSTVFSIKTNVSTRQGLKNAFFFMTIHNLGQEIKVLEFRFPENELEATLKIADNTLYSGVNIITIFNQHFEPLLERLIFKRKGIQRKQILVDYKKRKRDSLVIELSSSSSVGVHSMSVSVLPNGTEAYHPNNTIFSAFYLEPFIQGNLENGRYYFSDKTQIRRRNYDLDLLLLTQGWSKYSWQNIFNNTPKEFFKPEHGFTILGKISERNEKKENKVFLKSKENNLFAMFNLNADGTFELKNAFLKDRSSIDFGLINERNNETSKAPLYLRIFPSKTNTNLQSLAFERIVIAASNEKVSDKEQEPVISSNFLKTTTVLDSVILKTKEEEDNTTFTSFGGEKVKITEKLSKSFFYILDLIRYNGFRVERKATDVSIYSGRGRITLSAPQEVLIFMNGMQQYNNAGLLYLQTKDIESITFSKSGLGYGMRGSGGVIKIERKMSYDPVSNNSETISSIIISNGFAVSKEFYAPKYTSYSSPLFDDYGTIGWFPKVVLNKNGKSTLKMLNTLQPKINLYIEGMTAEGALISEIITIKTGSEMP